jgi:hypothetical protein
MRFPRVFVLVPIVKQEKCPLLPNERAHQRCSGEAIVLSHRGRTGRNLKTEGGNLCDTLFQFGIRLGAPKL